MIDKRATELGTLLLFTALLAAGFVSPSAATSYVPMSDEDLLEQSSLVLVGEVVAVASGPLAGPPSTDYTVRVERLLKGEDPGTRITVRVLGGMRPDGQGLRLFGAPRFGEGESVLLFLNPLGDDALRIAQFHFGAFHVVELDGRRLAMRNLGESLQLPALSDAQRAAAATFHQPRDAERFGSWIVDRAAGLERTADYLVKLAPGDGLRLAEKFTLLRSSDDNEPTRWFDFDTGGTVPWHIDRDGLGDLPGGGRAELRAALDTWENEPQTPIDFQFAGDSAASLGLTEFDDVNVLLFEDPNDEVDGHFSCVRGGVLAVGGPWFTSRTFLFRGVRYHLIGGADIIVNQGVDCAVLFETLVFEYFVELFAHELGHTLGLGHSCGDDDGRSPPCFGNPVLDDALMRAQFHGDGRGARLNADDLAGIRELYGGVGNVGGGPRPAAPSGLVARVVEGLAIRLGWQDNSSNEGGFEIERGIDGSGFVRLGQVAANVTQLVDSTAQIGVTYTYRVRATGSGGASAFSAPASATVLTSSACEASGVLMCALDGRFRVDMSWVSNEGGVGPGHVVPVDSESSGLFWFFDPTNWEVLVKVLDGCAVNERFWVFGAATTNVGYTLRVIDLDNGSTALYTNPLGVQAPAITDTGAFATCP